MSAHAFKLPPRAPRTQRLIERIERVGGGRELRPYIERDARGRVTVVRCKGCGAVLVRNGRPTRLYAEMTVEMDDGARHVTPMCVRCAKQRHTPETLERLYLSDLAELINEEKYVPARNPMELMSARKPVRSARTFALDRK